jgi:radical S-adenosyl methionine domain-containing protein 2
MQPTIRSLRFLNCQGGKKVPGKSLLEVGVDASLADAGWEPETFVERGGIFEWERQRPKDRLVEAAKIV